MTTAPTRPNLPLVDRQEPPALERGGFPTWLAASAAGLTGGLGVLIACAACCVPILVSVGLLTGAAAAGLHNVFLGVGAVLVLTAGALVLLRRRRAQRAGGSGCGDDCAC